MKQQPTANHRLDPVATTVADLKSIRYWRRLHIQLTILYGGATSLALAFLAAGVYQYGLTSEVRNLQRRLLNTVESLANSIEPDRVTALPLESRTWTPTHKAFLRRFTETARADKDIKSIYMMRPTNEPTRLRFVVDYERNGVIGKPGDIYDASNVPMLLKGFDRPVVEQEPVRDSFGNTLSAYAPVETLSGRSIAVLGVDVDASRLTELKNSVLLNTAIAFGIALLLLALVAFIVARNLRSPLTRIIEAAATISQGDLSTRIGLERKDELGIMSQQFDKMADQLQDRDFIRETFGRYLSSSIAAEVLNHRNGITLGGEERVVTVLFADLRGYSSISEQMSPAQVVTMLNQYLGAMNTIIDQHHGNVIEFLGDSIFAVFGAPNYQIDHAEQGMRCALEMLDRLHKLNESWRESGLACRWQDSGIDEITCRIGLHCGKVIAGNIGSQTRLKYSVIGDTVNVASRLERLNKQYESCLLISRDIYIQLPRDLMLDLVDRGAVNVKGRDQSVQVYSLSAPTINPL
ncbi:MAG: adenylate/guanylate cyclase domain-containing protein [Synechococcaceae cyanobacterium]|nr:adenylate/guanylate cyclase domain-containing protein [Synechococcaceae cyanobacterium]